MPKHRSVWRYFGEALLRFCFGLCENGSSRSGGLRRQQENF
nr:MAG TPA: hypothetical protein [Caudoviricetes sp.]